MANPETILQAVREWLKAASSLTDAQVRPAEDDAVRPAFDYLTVKVTVPGVRIGHDSKSNGLSEGSPTVAVTGERRGEVSIQGFGADSYDWLVAADLALSIESVAAAIQDDGVTIVSTGSVNDISALLDTSYEKRYLFEVEVRYRITGDAVTLIEATSYEATVDLPRYDGDPDAISLTFNDTI